MHVSWIESFVCWLKFHWSLFLSVRLTITNIGLDNGLAPNRQQVIIWTNADLIHWCIYTALGGDELNKYIFLTHYHLFLLKRCLKHLANGCHLAVPLIILQQCLSAIFHALTKMEGDTFKSENLRFCCCEITMMMIYVFYGALCFAEMFFMFYS